MIIFDINLTGSSLCRKHKTQKSEILVNASVTVFKLELTLSRESKYVNDIVCHSIVLNDRDY